MYLKKVIGLGLKSDCSVTINIKDILTNFKINLPKGAIFLDFDDTLVRGHQATNTMAMVDFEGDLVKYDPWLHYDIEDDTSFHSVHQTQEAASTIFYDLEFLKEFLTFLLL